MKHCVTCGRYRQRDEYNVNRRSGDGRDNTCKPCIKARRSRAAKPGHGVNRKWQLSKRYGLGPDAYEKMFEQQDGACAICKGPPDRSFAGREPVFAIDHNHVTGVVRELLCFKCNTRLQAIEDEQFMLLAREYLRKHGYQFVDDQGEPT